MKLQLMKSVAHSRHVLQGCQSLATAILEDGSKVVAVYDSSNDHWLAADNHLEEIGCLNHLNNQRVVGVIEFN